MLTWEERRRLKTTWTTLCLMADRSTDDQIAEYLRAAIREVGEAIKRDEILYKRYGKKRLGTSRATTLATPSK